MKQKTKANISEVSTYHTPIIERSFSVLDPQFFSSTTQPTHPGRDTFPVCVPFDPPGHHSPCISWCVSTHSPSHLERYVFFDPVDSLEGIECRYVWSLPLHPDCLWTRKNTDGQLSKVSLWGRGVERLQDWIRFCWFDRGWEAWDLNRGYLEEVQIKGDEGLMRGKRGRRSRDKRESERGEWMEKGSVGSWYDAWVCSYKGLCAVTDEWRGNLQLCGRKKYII